MSKYYQKEYCRLATGSAELDGRFIKKGCYYGRFHAENTDQFWIIDNPSEIKTGRIRALLHKRSWNSNRWQRVLIGKDHPIWKQVSEWAKNHGDKLWIYTGETNKESMSFHDVEMLMKTHIVRKKGTGSRLNTNQINQPLHWNEVTELAHWWGHGNASVVANSIGY